LLFCEECGCYIKQSRAHFCPSCRKYFCQKHINEHNCKFADFTEDEEEGFKEGDWVGIEGLPGIFKVLSVKEFNAKRRLIIKSLSDGKLYEVFVPPRRVNRLLKPLERVMRGVFGPPEKFDIFVDALRLRYAYLYNPASILSISKIDPLPHQIEAVYGRMLDSPEPRFLLADDVGLGKTIETGMLLKELKLRERVKRILIVVPPALQYKWQKELRERFNEIFQVYTGETLKTFANVSNPWTAHDQIITSLELAKMSLYKDWLKDVKWDMVIIDEAHKLAAHKFGNKVEYTDRFRLGELLHTRTRCLLLLTATPHSGEDYAFYRLVSLVDPYLFPSERDINREKLRRVMIRRIKEDLCDIFPPRESKTLSVEFSEEERRLYYELIKYVGYYFNLAKEEKRRGVGFAMVILQRRMASSIYAIKKSLVNRLERLEGLLKLPVEAFPELAKEDLEIIEEYEKNPEDVDEEAVERAMRNIESLTMARNKRELEIEIDQIKHLLELLDQVKIDSKASFLIDFIKKLHAEAPNEKVLVFTEYRDTMEYLKRLLEDEGYKGQISYIHGSMSAGEREDQVEAFRKRDDIRVMVATDAAAEGIDLQHNCHIMINYELPWNPNRIEQRIGRLHRYGQKKKVLIHNLLVKGTIEGAIFDRLLWKIDRIKSAMGERVFDVIGMLLSEVKIQELIMSIVAEGMKTFDAKIEDALRKIDKRRELIEMLERKCLMRDHINWSFLSSMRESGVENMIGESDVERFMKRFIAFSGGSLEEIDNGVYRIKLSEELEELTQLRSGEIVTFSREVAEKTGIRLITLGSSVMNRILKALTDPAFEGWTAVKIDPKGREGFLFVYSYSVKNAKEDLTWKRLFMLFHDLNTREIYAVNPTIIWDLENPASKEVKVPEEFLKFLSEGSGALNEQLKILKNSFEAELRGKLERELKIRLEDLKNYYETKIRESNERIRKYKMRLLIDKENMEIAIRREEANIREYRSDWESRERELRDKYTIVEEDLPDLMAVAIVLSKARFSKTKGEIEKIERLAIEEAIKYEISYGRKPLDVSWEFRGYDIVSEEGGERRFIEVKGFAVSGDVEMTSNEWIAAEKLKDRYWLYIVENALDDEKRGVTATIRNPYEVLKELAKVKEIRDFKVEIKAEDWKSIIHKIDRRNNTIGD